MSRDNIDSYSLDFLGWWKRGRGSNVGRLETRLLQYIDSSITRQLTLTGTSVMQSRNAGRILSHQEQPAGHDGIVSFQKGTIPSDPYGADWAPSGAAVEKIIVLTNREQQGIITPARGKTRAKGQTCRLPCAVVGGNQDGQIYWDGGIDPAPAGPIGISGRNPISP